MGDAYIALLQINVALGCLYNGLETGRYRTKLYDALVDAVNSPAPSYIEMAGELTSIFPNDSEHSENHHAVRRWIYELPDECRRRIAGIDRWNFDGTTEPEKLPRRYRWYFGKHRDKLVVWAFSIVAPLLLMWLSHLDFYVAWWLGSSVILIGQAIPVINIINGHRMIRKASRDVKERINAIVSSYEKRMASDTIKKAVEAIIRTQE